MNKIMEIKRDPEKIIKRIDEAVYFNHYKIKLFDWEKDVIRKSLDGTKIKKVWIVSNRKCGATALCKLLHWYRPETKDTYVCSNNLEWSKAIKKMPIHLTSGYIKDCDEPFGIKWMKPMTIMKIDEDVQIKRNNKEEYDGSCMYDGIFNPETYTVLNTYNWEFFTISVNIKDLDKIKPYIEADKGRDDVIVIVDDNLPIIYSNQPNQHPQIYNE